MRETIASLLRSYGPGWYTLFPESYIKKQFLDLDLKKNKNRKNDLKKTDFGDPLPPSLVNSETGQIVGLEPTKYSKIRFV